MRVKHCVITSVDRDDLKDGGSIIWAETIKAIREIKSPKARDLRSKMSTKSKIRMKNHNGT